MRRRWDVVRGSTAVRGKNVSEKRIDENYQRLTIRRLLLRRSCFPGEFQEFPFHNTVL